MRCALLALGLMLLPVAAGADDLVSGLSQDQIQITSNYTGSDLVVFGAIERDLDNGDDSDLGGRDVVVIVRGPDVKMDVRRKQRIAGIWINNREITLTGMPAYYFAASTRDIAKIASPSTLGHYQIGFDNVQPAGKSTSNARKAEQFRQAVVRERVRQHLYTEDVGGVEFLSYSLFRVHVPVPANAPRGQYTAEVFLFKNGVITSAQSTPLFVDQIGLERNLYNFAHHQGFAYGLATVAMALLLGWLSSFLFRKTTS
ncbi:MAG: TIGR02186 family protein [Rhizomicrobium sp.]